MAKFLKMENCKNCNRMIDLFKVMTKEEIERLNEKRYEVQFNAGEIIFKQGTSLTHIVCVTEGLVKIYIEGYNRRNLIMSLVRGGEMIAGPGMWTDNRHHFSVAAVEETTTCFVELPVFMEIVDSNQTLARELLKRSSERDIRNFEKMITLTQKQMHGKVADILLYLNKNIYTTNPMLLTINRQDLADMVSITKESLIRVLKEFKDAGFISLQGNELRIINEKVLKNVSENG
jgi:CRP/FNR family transcriptional regulator, polysaccharide utilization system transcription regulator